MSALFVALLYGIGFVVWNTRLIPFGFFEYNLLQVRFIAAGFVFLLILFILILILDFILSRFNEYEIQIPVVLIIVLLLGVIQFCFFQKIFIYIPQSFGGGRPIPTTILGTEEQIGYLSGLGVRGADNGDKKSIQTQPVCLVYQNDAYIVFQSINQSDNKISARNIPLSRDKFIGFSSIDPNASVRGCETLQ